MCKCLPSIYCTYGIASAIAFGCQVQLIRWSYSLNGSVVKSSLSFWQQCSTCAIRRHPFFFAYHL
jgi:hypothetical protein